MSVYYNQDITNREKDKRTSWPHFCPHLTTACIQTCYHGGQEGHLCRECLRGNSSGVSPAPNRDPALSAKVTTGGLSAPTSRWKVRWHLLWIYGSQPPVHAPLININIKEPQVVIFLLDKGAHFSVLPFSPGPQSNDKSYHLEQIWPVPRALIYPASGLLLGRPPLLSLFPHSSWNSNVPAGTRFTISTKNSNSPPPRQLFLLLPLSGTNRSHSVDSWV
jgi:hypothetical protein